MIFNCIRKKYKYFANRYASRLEKVCRGGNEFGLIRTGREFDGYAVFGAEPDLYVQSVEFLMAGVYRDHLSSDFFLTDRYLGGSRRAECPDIRFILPKYSHASVIDGVTAVFAGLQIKRTHRIKQRKKTVRADRRIEDSPLPVVDAPGPMVESHVLI